MLPHMDGSRVIYLTEKQFVLCDGDSFNLLKLNISCHKALSRLLLPIIFADGTNISFLNDGKL